MAPFSTTKFTTENKKGHADPAAPTDNNNNHTNDHENDHENHNE
jgi:hypothetical protein